MKRFRTAHIQRQKAWLIEFHIVSDSCFRNKTKHAASVDFVSSLDRNSSAKKTNPQKQILKRMAVWFLFQDIWDWNLITSSLNKDHNPLRPEIKLKQLRNGLEVRMKTKFDENPLSFLYSIDFSAKFCVGSVYSQEPTSKILISC